MKTFLAITALVVLVASPAVADISGKIVFTSDRDGNPNVYIVNADGTGEKQLTDDDASDDQPCLSPDGNTVVFISGRKGNNDVWLVKSGGGGEKRITKTDAMEYDPSFTPDGESVVFTRDKGDSKVIIKLDLSSGTEETLAEGYMARMSSDSTQLIYVSSESGDEELYIESANLTNSKKSDTWPSFSLDGSKVIFASRREGDYDTYVMNRDGSACKPILTSENSEDRAVFSPDGGYIAVASDAGGDYEISIYDKDGSLVKQLTDNDSDDYEPHWGK